MPSKFLILGCTGEVGSRLTNLLLSQGFIVYGISGVRKCAIVHPNHSCTKLDLLKTKNLFHEIKFKPEGVRISFSWDISLMQLEEYEAIALQQKFDASVSRDDVFGYITIDETWAIEFTNPKELKDSASFEFRPEQAIIYVDEKRVVIS